MNSVRLNIQVLNIRGLHRHVAKIQGLKIWDYGKELIPVSRWMKMFMSKSLDFLKKVRTKFTLHCNKNTILVIIVKILNYTKKLRFAIAKENSIYIRGEFTRKKCKTAHFVVLFPYCRCTYLYYITFWALEHHFIENLKSILKENQIMK